MVYRNVRLRFTEAFLKFCRFSFLVISVLFSVSQVSDGRPTAVWWPSQSDGRATAAQWASDGRPMAIRQMLSDGGPTAV